MEMNIKERVIEWAKSGGDFRDGLSLFLTFNRNVFYVRNIEAKGFTRGMETLVSEFANKTKLAAKDIWGMIGAARNDSKDRNDSEGLLRSARNDNEGATGDCRATLAMSGDGGKGRQGDGATGRIPVTTAKTEVEKRQIKLREEFPFLGREDCPDEMAIMVNKMLTAYDDYRCKRERLYEVDVNNRTACYKTAREILDAFILNRQCWAELNHYKIHGTVLGKMPEFNSRMIKERYKEMNTVKLVNILRSNIPRRMTYNKKELKKKNDKDKGEIRARLRMCEDEMGMIREILKGRQEF